MVAKSELNAKKQPWQADQALTLANRASKLLVAKGKKVVEVDLKKEKPSDEEILKLMLGPTGNLRAPTLVVGKTVIVGFNEEMYDSAL